MNVLLWIFQILLALHTFMGAIWKTTNPERAVSSLKAIPHGVWLVLIVVELLCSLGLVLPAFNKRLGIFAPVAASIIAAEMLMFCVFHLFSGSPEYGHLIYWLVVAVIGAFIAYGRFALKPLKS